MNKTISLAVAALLVSGCATFYAKPMMVRPGQTTTADPCIEKALARVRTAGFTESQLNKEAGFFRVSAPEAGAQWQVQCVPDGTAVVSYVDASGVRTEKDELSKEAFDKYADFAKKVEGY